MPVFLRQGGACLCRGLWVSFSWRGKSFGKESEGARKIGSCPLVSLGLWLVSLSRWGVGSLGLGLWFTFTHTGGKHWQTGTHKTVHAHIKMPKCAGVTCSVIHTYKGRSWAICGHKQPTDGEASQPSCNSCIDTDTPCTGVCKCLEIWEW